MASTDRSQPTVRVPEGWERTSATVETVFDATVVTVRAHTVVFEDARLGDAVRERTGADGTWRFFFAGRLRLRPSARGSRALARLVTDRANGGFVDRLRERGFADIEAVESRRFTVDRAEADLTRYRARVSVAGGVGGDGGGRDGVAVTVECLLAVWSDGDGFLVAGGAYPLAVDDEALAAALDDRVAPERHREELFELIRSTA